MRKIYSVLFLLAFFLTEKSFSQVLLNENFDGATFPPTGWTNINNGSGNDWTITTDATLTDGPYQTHSGTGAIVYEYDVANPANAWMITPGVALTGGVTYSISFFYRIRSATYPEKMKVTVGTAATVAAQTTVLWNNGGAATLLNVAYLPGVIEYTPASTGTYYFGFNAYSDADKWALLVDDIRIEVTPAAVPLCTTNTTPANSATGVAYIPFINLTWAAAPTATSYDFYIGTTTTPPYLLNTAGTSVSVSGGAPSTLYYWYVIPRNAKGAAAGCISSMTSFTTGAVPPPPVNNECAGAITLTRYAPPYNGTSISGTASAGTTSCGAAGTWGTPDEDVWFKITALQNGDATVTVVGGPTFDAVIQGYSGACGSLTSLGACTDANGAAGTEIMTLTGLVAGQTYYIRVYDWDAGAGDNFTISVAGIAVPISLAKFSGFMSGRTNILSWSTATEVNNKGFELERSADGINFTKVGFVATQANNGTSSLPLNYSYEDVKPLSGANYYRLKQIDVDEKFNYSHVVLLTRKITGISFTNIYPNVATNDLNLVIASPESRQVTLVLTDFAGRPVMQRRITLNIGDNQQQLDVSSLAAGTYLVKVICGNGCESAAGKFVKL